MIHGSNQKCRVVLPIGEIGRNLEGVGTFLGLKEELGYKKLVKGW